MKEQPATASTPAAKADWFHPLLSTIDAKAWESRLLRDETAEWSAMQRAGGAIACAVLSDFREIGGLPDAVRILVLAGKGHNGGDALLAARALLATRPAATATLVLTTAENLLRPLTQRALAALRAAAGVRLQVSALGQLKRELASFDLCLDGVFGFQFRPPLAEGTAELLAWVNTHPRIRLRAAVDLPSGLGGDSGETVFRADFTYATGIVKQPLVDQRAAPFVGRVRYLDLGFFAEESVPAFAGDVVLLPGLLRPLAQLRPSQCDKRTFGHLLIVGGSSRYPGAVLMSVQAALRSGVGLVTAFVPEQLVPEYAAKFPEVMWIGWTPSASGGLTLTSVEQLLANLPRATALVVGPGLGAEPETLAAIAALVRGTTLPLLLDADALRPEIVTAAGRPWVLTPHAGELARLGGLGALPPKAVVVQKGYPTCVHADGRRAWSFFGGPVLARGGSGDLLAGLLGGLLAQTPGDLWLAAARGVVWHGLAADLLARDQGQVAVQTTQWLEYLQPALHCADHGNT